MSRIRHLQRCFNLEYTLFRGLWGAIDEWTDDVIQDQPRNFVITALIAIILLIILGCFNTSSSRGVRNLQVIKNVI